MRIIFIISMLIQKKKKRKTEKIEVSVWLCGVRYVKIYGRQNVMGPLDSRRR